MIKARHSKRFDFIFNLYLNALFRSHFNAIHLFMPAQTASPEYPLFLLPNHNTWWDGFFVYLLNQKVLKRTMYLMMLEEQLKKNKAFTRLGVFSVNPANPKQALEYSLSCLKPHNGLCLFPQGELGIYNTCQMKYRKGIRFILEKTKKSVMVQQLAIKINFMHEQRADVFLLLGTPQLMHNADMAIADLESAHVSLLQENEQRISSNGKTLILVRGKQSINKRFEGKDSRH